MNKTLLILVFLLLLPAGLSNAQTQFHETVWLQLNRDVFLSGEDIEYTISLLETDTYNASLLSRNVRIELTDSQGNSIIKNNLELTDSKASGSMSLPVNLESGWYILSSYSNWMRNFPASEFTEQYIRVVKPEDLDNNLSQSDSSILNIEIYPHHNSEDQSLIKCGVFTSDKNGDAVSAEGIILSGPGDTVMTFHTAYTGWATSTYRPSERERYQVFVPGYKKENIALEIIDNTASQVQGNFEERYGYLGADLGGLNTGAEYKILVHRMNSWSWFQTARAEGGSLSIRIPARDLPSGISQVSVLDNNNKLVYKHLWSDYSEEAALVLIETDQLAGKRSGNHIFDCYSGGGFDSLGVNMLYILADKNIESSRINNYLPGLPGWPASYLIPASQDAFDAWISSQSYPDYVAEAFFIKNPDAPEASLDINNIEYLPETRGGTLQGRVYRSDNGLPVEDVYLALTILNDNTHFAAGSDKRGNFVFTFPEHRGNNDYLVNYIEEYDPSWNMEFINEYHSHKPARNKNSFSLSSEELTFLRQQKLNMDLEKIYYPAVAAAALSDSMPKKGAFYGSPDLSVKIDYYIQLPNLREVIYELVPYVKIVRHHKTYDIEISGEELFRSKYPTLVLLDGIPVYDYEEMLNLPPERLDYIDVVTSFYIHGNMIFEGIVNIKSVNNDFGGLPMPASTVLSSLSLPETRQYYPLGTVDKKAAGMPRLNTVLLWETTSQASENRVNVSLNDIPGTYRISVYGFDSDGKWHRGALLFDNPE